jgi:hypothetical protein
MEERSGSEFFGLPAMIFIFAVIAMLKGILEENLGFTIVGAVVAVGSLLAIGAGASLSRSIGVTASLPIPSAV